MKSIVNIGKLLVSIACVGALTTSCNSDFLDRPPLGTLDEVTYLLQTFGQLLSALTR